MLRAPTFGARWQGDGSGSRGHWRQLTAVLFAALLTFGSVGARAADTTALIPPGAIGDATPAPATPLPQILGEADQELYRLVFAQQRAGQWRKADRLIGKLSDPILLGHAQVLRYMHPTKYRSKYKDLYYWLRDYADHPGARRVYTLAQRRKPGDWKSPNPPTRVVAHAAPVGVRSQAAVDSALIRKTFKPTRASRGFRAQVRRFIRRGYPTGAYKLLRGKGVRARVGSMQFAAAKADIAHGYFLFGKDELALRLAEESHKESGGKVSLANWTGGLAAWRLSRFDLAAEQFEYFSRGRFNTLAERAAGAYWASRAHLIQRRPRQATRWLAQAAARGANFYSLLARRALGIEIPFDWSLPEISGNTLDVLLARPEVHRALALLEIGETRLAEREIRRILPALPYRLRRGVMSIAANHGMPGLAMRLAHLFGSEGERPYYAALYPVPNWTVEEKLHDIDAAIVYGVMRQESKFNPRAKSRRGARGLMQLMPRTAAFVGDDKRLRGRNRAELFKPELNITLGRNYLRHLMNTEVVGRDLVRMLAAYNAGPGNLSKWQRKVDYRGDPLLFIESIRSRETRDFVETVLTNIWMYRLRLGQPAPTLDRVASGAWPGYESIDPQLAPNRRHAQHR
jgi:soluble lytic murein transglycosylase